MSTRKKEKLWGLLLAGFLLCYPGNFAWADNGESGDSSGLQQIEKSITGTVVDAKGEPLIGVSVSIRGGVNSSVRANTDVNGRYSIKVSDENQVLQFTYIGFKTFTATANKDVIDVILQEDAQVLGEVVVIGYGTQSKQNLTGAVSSVDVNKTLDSRPIADVGRSLQGVVPGLSITVPSGEVGSDPVFRIRGQIASINANGSSSPLILLDNVEIPSISLVNPDDIESITVLKDAAASSIYGAKAALGVVLITTKKGAKTESVSISYSNNYSWSKVAKDINLATIDGLEYAMEAAQRVGTSSLGAFWSLDANSLERSREWVKKYGSMGPDEPMVFGRDWYWNGSAKYGVRLYNAYDHMIEEWTPTKTHNLSINGRTGKTSYNIGLGYFDQSGLLKTAKKDEFTRYNATLKLSTEINKYFTVRSGFLYSQRNKQYPYATNSTTADPWLYLYRWGPLQPFGVDEDGNPLRSPASEIAAANTAIRRDNYLNVNLGATVNITKDWNLEFDYTFANNEFLNNRPGTRFTAADTWSAPVVRLDANGNQYYVNADGAVVSQGTPGAMLAYQLPYTTYTGVGANPDHIRREASNMQQHTYNAYTTYNLKLQDIHAFKFMAGFNIVEAKTISEWAQRTELFDYTNPQFDMATGAQTVGGQVLWDAQAGFFGRINYSFMDKYLVEGNLRYDGSSKFPTDLKWRYFPSFSAGWRAGEEAFMEWTKPALSALKFRGSWGVIGDQSVGGSNLYISNLTSGTSSWLIGSTKPSYYITPAPVDGNITWQDFETLDFGVDIRLLNNELGATFDWYQRTTKNMIAAGLTLPYSFGAPAPVGNYAELQTKGWEFSLDYNHRFENGVGINAMVTLSDAVSIISDYDENAIQGTGASAWYKGKRYGDIWGYRTDRLYQLDDFELDAKGNLIEIDVLNDPSNPNSGTKKMYKLKGDNPVYQNFVQNASNFRFGPGDVKFKDLNGDGRITNGSNTADDPGDLQVIGNSTPRYQYGFRLGGDYKGFDLSIFFQGVGSRDIWGDGALAIPGYNVSDGAMSQTIAGDYWREDRTDAFYPRPYNIGAVAGGATTSNNTQMQDRYLLDMSYLRLKNVTLGYSLPANLIKKVFLTKARIYASAENLVTWDNLRGLPIDPEVINSYSMWDTSNYNSGRTGVGAPMFKNVSVGLQITF
jgi:TonB-linked SusC/RagA family outer membrane protein